MTVYSTESYTDWVATDGVLKNFNYDFTVFQTEDMYVLTRLGLDGPEVRVDDGFTMTPTGPTFSGGVVTYPSSGAAIAAGSYIRLVREVEYTQKQKIGNEGSFRPEIHERALDRLTQQTQQLARDVDRSFKMPLGETAIDPDDFIEIIIEGAAETAANAAAAALSANEAEESAAAAAAAASILTVQTYATKALAIAADVNENVGRIHTGAFSVTQSKGAGSYVKTSIENILKQTAPEISSTVKLFVPMNGPAGLTSAYDLSPSARIVTRSGQVVVSATQKAYNHNMAYFDGVGDNLNVPSSADFAPAGTFSVSVEAYVEDLAAERVLFGWITNSTAYISWSILTDGSVQFRQWNGGGTNIEVTSAPGEIVAGQLYELGLSRLGTDKWSITKRDPSAHSNEAEIIATVSDATPITVYTSTFRIGQLQATGATFKGWLGQFWFKHDASWEGAEDQILLPETAYFKSNNNFYWLLDNDLVNPEHFGEAGSCTMDPVTGLMSGTQNDQILRECQEFCAIMGKEMRLVSKYWYANGEWAHKVGCKYGGASRFRHGVFLDTTREKPGILWLGQGHEERECFISIRTPSSIQNGQGYFGTSHTFSRPIVRAKTRHVGETDAAYGLRCAPPHVSGSIKGARMLRRAGGGAHCFCSTSRARGIYIDDVACVGWSLTTGRWGSIHLTHWGFIGTDWPKDQDGIILEPMITRVTPGTYTMHPNNIFMSKIHIKYGGRLLNTSASYDIYVDGFHYEGTDNDSSADGGQIVAHTVGDEWDRLAHPDDLGKVYANLVVKNGQGHYLEANSPNGSDRALISMSGAATSKVVNVDGSFAIDDLAVAIPATPGVLAPAGGTTTINVPVPGVLIADSPNVGAWFSKLGDDSSTVIDASVVVDGTIRCVFTNNDPVNPLNLTTPGMLNAYLPRKRLEAGIWYSGVECSNIRAHGVGGTGYIMYLRNGAGQTKFQNIQYLGAIETDGLSIQNWRGPTHINLCTFPGANDIGTVEDLTISNTKFDSNTIIQLSLNIDDAPNFAFGDLLTGSISGVQAVVHEIVDDGDDDKLYVRLVKRSGKVFQVGETVENGAETFTATITAVAGQPNANLLIRGSTSSVTVGTGGALKYAETLPVTSGFSYDVKAGDKLTWAGGTIWVDGYHDTTSTAIKIKPLCANISAGTVLTLDRRSRVKLENVDIVGGYRGLETSYADVIGSGVRIAETWQYGFLQGDKCNIAIRDMLYEGNGLGRLALDTGLATRDYIALAGCDGSLSADAWIFRDGEFVHTNFLVPAASLRQGSLRNSTFMAAAVDGTPISARYTVTTPLVGGVAFSAVNNVDTAGIAV